MREVLDHHFHFTDEKKPKKQPQIKTPKAQREKGARPESLVQAVAELGCEPRHVTPEPTFSIICSTRELQKQTDKGERRRKTPQAGESGQH